MSRSTLTILADYYQTQGKHYAGAVVGVTLSLLMWAVYPDSKLAARLSLTGILMSFGYGLGVASTSQKLTRYSEVLEAEWSDRLLNQEQLQEQKLHQARTAAQQHKANLETAKDELEEAIAKLKSAHQNNQSLSAQVATLTAQINGINRRYQKAIEAAQKALTQQFETRLKQESQAYYRQCLDKIKARNSEHRQREQFLIAELNKVEAFHKAQWESVKEKYESLLDEYQKVVDSYHPEIGEIKAIFTQQMSSVIEERDRIYAQLARYHDSKPFMGSSRADINGNRLIDYFLEPQRGIICDADHCESHFEFDEIWIRPRNATVEQLEKFSSDIHRSFELLKQPEFAIDRGCIKVVLRLHSKEKSASSTHIEEQPENWLEAVAKTSNHYRISAPTDWGKSVFLDNLIYCLKLLHGEDFKLSLLDPKYPFTHWSSGLVPTHTKFDGCIAGMADLGVLIENRINEAEADVKAGRAIRHYPAHLFAIDEMEVMVDEARDRDDGAMRGKTSMRLIRLLRKGLKLGRGLTTQKGKGIIVAYVTQSPLCSRINLNKDDFDNSSNIFIGENIPIALSQELDKKLSNKDIAYLTRQYELRRERGDLFFALIKTPKTAFIATLPPEGYYASKLALQGENQKDESSPDPSYLDDVIQALESNYTKDFSESSTASPQPPNLDSQPPIESSDEIIHCPQCGSTSCSKNGKKRGKQYYKCANCRKQFPL